jgi:hypothetical protein
MHPIDNENSIGQCLASQFPILIPVFRSVLFLFPYIVKLFYMCQVVIV